MATDTIQDFTASPVSTTQKMILDSPIPDIKIPETCQNIKITVTESRKIDMIQNIAIMKGNNFTSVTRSDNV